MTPILLTLLAAIIAVAFLAPTKLGGNLRGAAKHPVHSTKKAWAWTGQDAVWRIRHVLGMIVFAFMVFGLIAAILYSFFQADRRAAEAAQQDDIYEQALRVYDTEVRDRANCIAGITTREAYQLILGTISENVVSAGEVPIDVLADIVNLFDDQGASDDEILDEVRRAINEGRDSLTVDFTALSALIDERLPDRSEADCPAEPCLPLPPSQRINGQPAQQCPGDIGPTVIPPPAPPTTVPVVSMAPAAPSTINPESDQR